MIKTATFAKGTTCGVLLGVVTRGRVVAAAFGLGWDDDQPLRPWPWLTTKAYHERGTYYCLSCCGLWVGGRIERLPGGAQGRHVLSKR